MAHRVADNSRKDSREQQTRERLADGVLGEQPRGIGADAEEGGVAERDDAGVAEDQVKGQREKRRDRDLAREREVARRNDERQQRAQPEHDLERTPARPRTEVEASVFQRAPPDAT